MKIAPLLFFVFVISGCQSLKHLYYDVYDVSFTPKQQSQVKIKYDYDKFEKNGWLSSDYYMSEFKENMYLNGIIYKFRSYYNRDNKKPDFTQIYFVFKIPDWYFIDEVYGENGKRFDFSEIDREVWTAGNVYETFAITLTDEDLEELMKDDFDMKIVGKRGSEIFSISSVVSKAFFNEVRKKEK